MNGTEISVYRMNPAEDEIRYGDELENGMLVLASDEGLRRPYGKDEGSRLRAQRFRRVTRLRHEPATGSNPATVGLYFALDMAGMRIAADAVRADPEGAARQLGLD